MSVTWWRGGFARLSGGVAIGLLFNGAASGVTVPLGVATGGVAIHYNNNMLGEVPTNQAYVRAQFSVSNSNGAQFSFDSTPLPGTGGMLSWFSIFQVVPNQFGLDLILQAPTSDLSNPTPPLIAYDNGDNSLAGRIPAGQVTWAISGYTGATNGPADPGNQIINSLFRGGTGMGDGISNLVTTPVSHMGTVFTTTVSGELISDGSVHWYTIGTPDSPVGTFELTGNFRFNGTLSYDSSTDMDPLMDFYAGTVQLDAEVLCAARYVDAASGQDVLPGPTPNFCRNMGQPCKTVQRSVDIACPGDTIHVAAGSYPEQVTIGKSLTIIGAGASLTTIQAPGTLNGDQNHQNVVTIEGAGVTVDLSGVTVSGPGPSGCGSIQAGIMVRAAADANIHDNTVSNIRDNPLSGCQNGFGILVGDRAAPSTSATATITNNSVAGYQKNGVDLRNGGTFATISGNTISGIGATPLIAQNGVVLVGAAGAILGNAISGNECDHPTACGPDPVASTQSAGVLVLNPPAAVQVANNDVSNNDIGVYSAAASTTISGNALTGNRYEGIILDEGAAGVTLNRVDGGNIGIAVLSFTGSAANSAGNLTCNRIGGAGSGITLIDDDLTDANIPTIVANKNVIEGNGAGINNTTSTSVDATNNWWGCATGPNTAGCDSVSAHVTFSPFATSVPTCVNCSNNADCDDGLTCTGTETCKMGSCAAGTPVVCAGNQCNDSACAEPSGTCALTPKVNGFACDDGDVCTTSDTCQSGVCVGSGGGDSDGDGYCDQQEIAAGCNPDDFLEIPLQANVYSGGRRSTGRELLLTYDAPAQRKLAYATDPSCGAAGACSLTSHFCTSGAIGDPCTVNADCNHTDKCRIVINYAATPDLLLTGATLKLRRQPRADVAPLFSPATPGCTRKVDITLAPGFKRARLRLKATGTIDNRKRKDRDILIFDE